jgi:hypothetical protein
MVQFTPTQAEVLVLMLKDGTNLEIGPRERQDPKK